ncbi:MAG: disulfide oxidoreductase [Alphaproteobacteria bacterium]|nr:disulfide oxidoreductase [Alphaproteobacteria bacterium]
MADSVITAVLGPTNTGKTYLAIEKMMTHKSAMIGFPLRLLARENYDKIVRIKGEKNVALITGEEKILPDNPSYYVCTVEAMPLEQPVDFLAVDEIQMAADVERGHIFTDRLLYARGKRETMFLGAETIKPLIKQLIPEITIETRPRFSKLTYTGIKKITRLPARSAIIGFSVQDVYALAELIRRQKGGAAVVMGALSPRTRNAQVDMFQSGEVDYLVATDAIGMGLNMDIGHVCFTSLRKFDGQRMRALSAAELAQIAGRAGRYMTDGTFGAAAEASAMTQDVIDRIEEHRFENLVNLFWRNHDLKTTSLDALIYSLNVRPAQTGLITARKAEDQQVLEVLMQDSGIEKLANHPSRVKLLWEICQIPDFRKVSPQAHAKLAGQLFRMILDKGKIEQDWFAKQVKTLDNTNGDIDVVTGRIAGIRIWTYIAQRKEWIDRSSYWRDMTRAVEDKLSDALHQKLSQRFVDKRTSVLVKGMKTQVDLEAQIGEDGSVSVEGQTIGKLEGLRFMPDTGNGKFADRVLMNAADKALQTEFQARIAEILDPEKDDLTLENDARILWKGQNLGKVVKGRDILHPAVSLTVQENIDSSYVEQLRTRLNGWLEVYLNNKILPLFKALRTIDEEGASGSVRGILYQAADQLGTIRREKVLELVKNLTEADKKILAKTGVRMGYEYIFFPMLLKPAAQRVCALLWKIWNEKTQFTTGFAIDGKMSFAVEKNIPWALYLVQGYVLAGTRAIRVDVMERFTSKLREVTRQDKGKPQVLPLELLSIAGLKRDEAAEVFGFLGFNVTKETQTVTVGEETKETETLMIQPKFKKHKKAPKEEKIDETSPFAALAALKKK